MDKKLWTNFNKMKYFELNSFKKLKCEKSNRVKVIDKINDFNKVKL